ncbi:MAG: hypothetical protein ABW168_14170 [Sedimenticola sp.]
MGENRDYLEMSFHSINCFANDGKLDINELNQILDIAMRDGVVDDNEKRVLQNIISRVKPSEMSAEMAAKVIEIRQKHF